jgi:GTP-binding protein
MDTGGLVPGTRDTMETAILDQARMALDEAELILFMVDVREGLTAVDREIAEELRPRSEKVLVVANKVESPKQELAAGEVAELGLGNPWLLSGQHGRGVGDLLDAVVERLPRRAGPEDESEAIHVALVGRPNVGKSSLANRLLGEPRLIVHPVAGTTRDAVDVPFRFNGVNYVLVDTAGLRRRSHVAKGVEYYSALRTRKSLERCDVAIFVLDATEPITAQDARIASMIVDEGKSAIILNNKWDLKEKDTHTTGAVVKTLREKLPLLSEAPILFVSALTGQRVSRILPLLKELYDERRRRVTTSVLNEVLKEATDRLQPPMRKNGKPLKLYYVTQVADSPPRLAVFANAPDEIPAAYKSYLRNLFRDRLELRATPLRMDFRARRR